MRTIREMRIEMGCSYGEAAELLGIHKATYQRYDEETCKIPAEVTEKMTQLWQTQRGWLKSFVKRMNADLDRKYPMGIASMGGE